MSFTNVRHQHATPPMTSPAPVLLSDPALLSDNGDAIRISGYNPFKRLFDIAVAVSLLVLLAPLLLLIGLAVRLETRGPALFRQTRNGAGCRSFLALKFRTMHVDAEARLEALLAVDAELKQEYNRHHKLHDDPRVTRLGRFLRRTSLDELPQLWNVLTGDMSLIGPRPYMPHELISYPRARSAIARVKPGITGLWQVSGRHRTTFEDRLRFDIAYVDGYSFWQDMVILGRTVMVIAKADGV